VRVRDRASGAITVVIAASLTLAATMLRGVEAPGPDGVEEGADGL
jgi:hypothetical protein